MFARRSPGLAVSSLVCGTVSATAPFPLAAPDPPQKTCRCQVRKHRGPENWHNERSTKYSQCTVYVPSGQICSLHSSTSLPPSQEYCIINQLEYSYNILGLKYRVISEAHIYSLSLLFYWWLFSFPLLWDLSCFQGILAIKCSRICN